MLDLETDGRTAPREARAKRSPRRLPKVLVSGGSGFLGQHLVAALCARGHEVRILDRVAPHALAPRVEFVSGSVLDRSAVAAAMDGVGCVYHLAGIAHLWAPRREDFDAVNRRGTVVTFRPDTSVFGAQAKFRRRFLDGLLSQPRAGNVRPPGSRGRFSPLKRGI